MVNGMCAERSNFGPASKVKYVKIGPGPYLMNCSIDLDCSWWMGVCLVEGMHRGQIFDLPQSSWGQSQICSNCVRAISHKWFNRFGWLV